MSDRRDLIFDEIRAKIIEHNSYVEIRTNSGDMSIYFGFFKLVDDKIVSSENFTNPLKKVGGYWRYLKYPLNIILTKISVSQIKPGYMNVPLCTQLNISIIESCDDGEYEEELGFSCSDVDVDNCQYGVVERYTPAIGSAIVPYDENRRGAFDHPLLFE